MKTAADEIRARDFRLLAAGQTLSWLGNGFQTVALAVALVLAGGGASALGTVMSCSIVAMLVCTLFGGVWADRLQPQQVMAASDAVRCIATGGLAVMFAAGYHPLPLVCAVAAINSGAGAFFSPAMRTLKPMVCAVERRQSTNATLGLLQTASSVIGPAAGGLVVAAFGAATGFAVDAVSFLASIATVVLIRAHVDRTPNRAMLREMASGWAEVRRRDWLFSGVLAATAYHVANGIVLVLAQVVAIRELGGASAAGAVAAAEGLGGVVGALVALRFRPARLLRAGWIALVLMPLWVLSYVWPATLSAVVAGAVLGYAGLSFFSVAWETAIQDHVPHRMLGRVASWDTLTSFVAMPVGTALAGPLSNAFGVDHVFVGCALTFFVASVSPLFVAGSRRLVRVTGSAPAPIPVPAPALAP